ncbi:hypothetical protein [Komagataeibacter saccharivorans]|uniref:hypothetical protein n=2 Tax=Komagataeibacter saccharivorans TaxID=265959 RepID=UPI0015E88DE5|nr:hypothetical protein [Komagataeibacter saccharivorans]
MGYCDRANAAKREEVPQAHDFPKEIYCKKLYIFNRIDIMHLPSISERALSNPLLWHFHGWTRTIRIDTETIHPHHAGKEIIINVKYIFTVQTKALWHRKAGMRKNVLTDPSPADDRADTGHEAGWAETVSYPDWQET